VAPAAPETTTVSPRTNPSLASLLTSRYPHEHGVRNLLLPLEPENRTLAEILHPSAAAAGKVKHEHVVLPELIVRGT
jgi:arylsulfatase A-like enzyme